MQSSFVMVPGIGGSGPDHWQSLWEASQPGIIRIAPRSWDVPDLDDWISALENAVGRSPKPPVVICHSLGCLLFAHWRAASSLRVAGAVLTAVPDPAGPAFPEQAKAFGVLPAQGFGDLPVLAVTSTNDPYDPYGRGRAWAEAKGASICPVGPLGHLNVASGVGDWPEGRVIVAEFIERLER